MGNRCGWYVGEDIGEVFVIIIFFDFCFIMNDLVLLGRVGVNVILEIIKIVYWCIGF